MKCEVVVASVAAPRFFLWSLHIPSYYFVSVSSLPSFGRFLMRLTAVSNCFSTDMLNHLVFQVSNSMFISIICLSLTLICSFDDSDQQHLEICRDKIYFHEFFAYHIKYIAGGKQVKSLNVELRY